MVFSHLILSYISDDDMFNRPNLAIKIVLNVPKNVTCVIFQIKFWVKFITIYNIAKYGFMKKCSLTTVLY
jgi:hypothetical protein